MNVNWKEELESLEDSRRWKDAVATVQNVIDQHPQDPEAYVRAIYLLLNLLLEEDYASHGFDDETLAGMLKRYFDQSFQQFGNNAEYLFFTGYFMGLAEWYFGQETLDLSHQMLEKATQLEPENPLYEWAYRFVLGDERSWSLCEKLISDSNRIKWLDSRGSPGKYIINVLRSCQT